MLAVPSRWTVSRQPPSLLCSSVVLSSRFFLFSTCCRHRYGIALFALFFLLCHHLRALFSRVESSPTTSSLCPHFLSVIVVSVMSFCQHCLSVNIVSLFIGVPPEHRLCQLCALSSPRPSVPSLVLGHFICPHCFFPTVFSTLLVTVASPFPSWSPASTSSRHPTFMAIVDSAFRVNLCHCSPTRRVIFDRGVLCFRTTCLPTDCSSRHLYVLSFPSPSFTPMKTSSSIALAPRRILSPETHSSSTHIFHSQSLVVICLYLRSWAFPLFLNSFPCRPRRSISQRHGGYSSSL